jgi:hypothetical protein
LCGTIRLKLIKIGALGAKDRLVNRVLGLPWRPTRRRVSPSLSFAHEVVAPKMEPPLRFANMPHDFFVSGAPKDSMII